MTTWGKSSMGHYIYKNTLTVFYNYDPDSRQAENTYKSGKDNVDELFAYADSIGFFSIKGLDEKNLPPLKQGLQYRIIEYRKGETVYRVCFDENAEDNKYPALISMVSMLNRFW